MPNRGVKLSEDRVRTSLADIGFTLLSPCTSAKSNIRVSCNLGHTFITIWDRIRHGNCPVCNKRPRLDTVIVSQKLSAIGFTLLSEYKTAKSPITVVCPFGHKIVSTWDTVRRGACIKCAGSERLSEQDYHNAAKEHELLWVGEHLPKNNSEKTIWACNFGHSLLMTIATVKNKFKRCRICDNRRQRLFEQDYIELAKSVGVEWLGPLPRQAGHRTNWKCSRGHVYSTSYKSVSHRGAFSACRECKRIAFTGPGHPRWKGGIESAANKSAGRARRYGIIERNNAGVQLLTHKQWVASKKFFGNKCAYCRCVPKKFHHDHFVPVVLGGQDTASNIVPSCPKCNHTKSYKPPLDWLIERFGQRRGAQLFIRISNYLDKLQT